MQSTAPAMNAINIEKALIAVNSLRIAPAFGRHGLPILEACQRG